MKLYNYKDLDLTLYFQGDIHGEFNVLLYSLKSESVSNAIVILLGDCGLGFNKPQYYKNTFDKLNKWCEKHNVHLLMFRGNHDDPEYFDGETVNLPYVKAIPDYSIVMTKHGNVLCIGGATSVDRTWRLQEEKRINRFKHKTSLKKKLYWDNEAVINNPHLEQELIKEDIKIDIVATHTRPTLYHKDSTPSGENWFDVDKELKNDVQKDANILNDVLTLLLDKRDEGQCLFWYHGHYHYYSIHHNKEMDLVYISLDNDRISLTKHNKDEILNMDEDWCTLDLSFAP